MSERNYYVICDDNCKFEAMTKEQIITAIAEATGETPTHIDDAFITKIKEMNKNAPLKMWIGTSAEYNALQNKEPNCLYFLTDETNLEEMQTQILEIDDRLQTAESKIAKSDVVLWEGAETTYGVDFFVEDLSQYNLICMIASSDPENVELEATRSASIIAYRRHDSVSGHDVFSGSGHTGNADSYYILKINHIDEDIGRCRVTSSVKYVGGVEQSDIVYLRKIIGIC